jgi:hypothetical protein
VMFISHCKYVKFYLLWRRIVSELERLNDPSHVEG